MVNPCRQAEHWMTLQEASELNDETAHLLKEHLEACRPCRQQARGLSLAVSMLRAEPIELRPELFTRVMDGVEAATATKAPPWWASRPLAVAAVAACIALVVGAIYWGRSSPTPHSASTLPPSLWRSSGQTPETQQPAWQVMIASGAHRGASSISAGDALGRYDEINVADSGIAVLASARGEVVVVDGGSAIEVGDASNTLRLLNGSVSVVSEDSGHADHREVTITAGQWSVWPVGTEFSVRYQAPRAPVVRVSAGEVHVRSRDGERALSSGATLTARGETRRLSARAGRTLSERLRLARQLVITPANSESGGTLTVFGHTGTTVSIDGFAAGAGEITALLAVGSHQITIENADGRQQVETIEVETGEEEVLRSEAPTNEDSEVRRSGAPAHQSQEAPEDVVQEVERLLAAGRTAEARSLALRALERQISTNRRAALQMLVAESHVRDGSYETASDAYHRIHRSYQRSGYGAHSLYMAGSLELFQRSRPGEAARIFRTYLSTYPRGRQRQGAYYSLIRALRAQGRSADARQIVERYLAEYPNGRYRDALTPIGGEGRAPSRDGGSDS